MRTVDDVILNSGFKEKPFAESQTRQSNEMFVYAAGDDGEFGLDVDGREGREEVVEETGGLVDY